MVLDSHDSPSKTCRALSKSLRYDSSHGFELLEINARLYLAQFPNVSYPSFLLVSTQTLQHFLNEWYVIIIPIEYAVIDVVTT